MARSFLYHPLPRKVPLSGILRFPASLDVQPRTWFLRSGEGLFPFLEMGTDNLPFQEGLRITPGFREGKITRVKPETKEEQALLIDFDWDWVEYRFRPLQDLLIQAVHWSPDAHAVCGSYHLSNASSRARKIDVFFQSQSEDRGASGGLSPSRFKGRMILSGIFGGTWAGFLLAEGELEGNGVPTLAARTIVQGGENSEVRWVFASGNSRAELEDRLEQTLRLDWEGELARKKVAHESRLRIETGDPDRDLLLASNQNMSRRIFENLTREARKSAIHSPALSPLQAWQLYLSLVPISSTELGKFLSLVFPAREGPEANPRGSRSTGSGLPLKAALLWQVSLAGHPAELWGDFLSIIESELECWFDPVKDQDGDGIPAILYPGPFQDDSAGSESGKTSVLGQGVCLLEHPGLAALLANEICKLAALGEITGREPLPAIWESRRKRLADFISQSWHPAECRFQSREAETHIACQGRILTTALDNGWHSLRMELPQPSRIMVQYLELPANLGLATTRIILHGMDWNGNYRVEEISRPLIDWDQRQGAAVTDCVYSRLDYLSITGLDPKSRIVLQVPTSDPRDIHHLLPFWLSDLHFKELTGQETISPGCLDELLSDLGLRSYSGPGTNPVQLTWNILAVQGLLQQGQNSLAERICSSWFQVLEENFQSSASHLSAWECQSGKRLGRTDSVESSYPVQLLLELAGLSLGSDGSLVCEPQGSSGGELCLVYRGIEIRLSPDQLSVSRPGEVPITYSRDSRQVIQLSTSPSVNIST